MNENQGNLTTIDIAKFKDTVLFSITIRRFGNSKGVKDMAALAEYMKLCKQTTNGDAEGGEPVVFVASDRTKTTKKLLSSKRLDRLNKAMTALKGRVESVSIPSMFRPGLFVSKQSNVLQVEKMLKEGWQKIADNELKDFITNYPDDKEAAKSAPVKKGGLGPLYVETDYPTPEELEKLFGIEWYWMKLSVPENIPDELRAEANEKFKRRMEDAAAQIEEALRKELLELVAHAAEVLAPVPGEKPKVIRDSCIGNLVQFIETFEARDVFSDEKLKPIMEQVRGILLDQSGKVKIAPQKLREYGDVRAQAAAAFTDIKGKLDSLIVSQGRQLDLED
jgi:hypothetical protein